MPLAHWVLDLNINVERSQKGMQHRGRSFQTWSSIEGVHVCDCCCSLKEYCGYRPVSDDTCHHARVPVIAAMTLSAGFLPLKRKDREEVAPMEKRVCPKCGKEVKIIRFWNRGEYCFIANCVGGDYNSGASSDPHRLIHKLKLRLQLQLKL